MPTVDFKLYLVGDRHQTEGRPLTQVVQAAAKAGVGAIQFREKDLNLADQYHLAKQVQIIVRKFGAKLFVNDRVDLCRALDADGVHLPASGLPVDIARKLLGPDKLIAVSCHSEKEVVAAESAGADFAVLGPVYETPSKRPFGPPLTITELQKVKSRTNFPVFAIGGIDLSRIHEVLSAGADGIALISAITRAKNIDTASRQILDEIYRASSASR